MLWISLIN